MLKYFSLIVLFLVVFACGETKELVRLNDKEQTRYSEMFHEGVRYKQKKQFQNAIHVFEACTQLNQFDDAPYFALSEIYTLTGQKEKAIEALQKAFEIDPKNQWYKEELTYKFHNIENYKEAIKGYIGLLKDNPQNAEWLIALSECYFKNNQMKKSFQTIEKIEQLIGSTPEIIIEKYRLLYFQKKFSQGEKLIQDGLKVFPDNPDLLAILVDFYFDSKQDKKALQLLFRLSEVDPTNGNVHIMLAQHYLQHNDLPNTYKELKMAFVCPEIPLENKTRFTMYFFDTQSKLDKNVIELGQILTEQYPKDAKVHTLLGDLYMKNDNEVLALASFKQAIELDPSKYSIWEQVMVMEYEFQQYENLYKDGSKAVELFPSYGKLYLLAGTAANQIKKYQEAIDLLVVGKDLIVNNPELKAEFHAQIGQAYFKLKKIGDAKQHYEDAISLAPDNKLNLNNYAYYLAVEKTDLDKAEKFIKEVLATSPNDYHFLDTYGWVLFQKGEFKKALETFEKAVAANPSEALINEHLGDCFYKEGKTEDAVKYWKKAFELGSKNSSLPKKIEKKHYYDPAF
jgi:tetratricopeptide (TPR) repeat protein